MMERKKVRERKRELDKGEHKSKQGREGGRERGRNDRKVKWRERESMHEFISTVLVLN